MSSTDLGGGSFAPGAAGVGREPKEIATDAARAVKQEAASFATEAKDKATEKLDQQKETAAQTLSDFANAVRKAGDELAGSDQSMATQFVRKAADGLEGFARTVADKQPEELLEAVREFGRRNPAVIVAGSVLAGVAIGRLLRSSGAHVESKPARAPASEFTAPGGASAYPLADLDAAGATVLGSDQPPAAADADAFGSRT